MGRLLPLVSLLLLAACQADQEPEPSNERRSPSTPDPSTLFDVAPAEFDTVETPPREMVFGPPTEAPSPPAPPVPPEAVPPAPPPPRMNPPPLPTERGVSGSCDVRSTEDFCFTYSGTGWTPSTAEAHCRLAPASSFGAATCPTADRIATCTFVRDGQMLVYSYYAPYALDLARLACPGEFVADGR